jgi:kynurenine formamidase
MATIDDFRAAAARVRNWGRWGDDDQLGTLNLLGPECVREAAGLVQKGTVFALGVSFDAEGPWSASGYRRNPIHLMTVDGGDEVDFSAHVRSWGQASRGARELGGVWRLGPGRFYDDYIMMPLQAASQWDALAHVSYDGQLYNGYPAGAVTSQGATRNGIEHADVKGITGRGVLLDVARAQGVEYLEPGAVIEPEELEAVARAQGVSVGPGDIVVVRTGWWSFWLTERDGTRWLLESPGLGWRCAEWLHAHDVAAVACDNGAVESVTREVDGVFLPLHLLCVRDMGMMLGEVWDLEALAADCAADGRFAFQLVAPPLRVTGAVGSPVNPIAMK